MALELEWTYDEEGNPPDRPVVRRWQAIMQGKDWTPQDWGDYMWLPHSTFPDVSGSGATVVYTADEAVGGNRIVTFDAADPGGKLLGTHEQEVVTGPDSAEVEVPLETGRPGTAMFHKTQRFSANT